MIAKSWACLNRNCLNTWNTFADRDPYSCPSCTGVRIKWVPKSIAINFRSLRLGLPAGGGASTRAA